MLRGFGSIERGSSVRGRLPQPPARVLGVKQSSVGRGVAKPVLHTAKRQNYHVDAWVVIGYLFFDLVARRKNRLDARNLGGAFGRL